MTAAIGVIGLGNMGRGIARNYIRKGFETRVWDAAPAAREAFAGDAILADPVAMAAASDMIIFVVPGSPEIDDVMKAEMLEAAKPGLVIYDFTTSDPAYSKRLAVRAGEYGVPYMDAGMTGGGAKGADEGTMTLMIGGDPEVFETTREWLGGCATELIYLGPSGAGHTMKVVHNMITHTNFFALCEAVWLGKRAGIAPEDLIKVFNKGNARSFISERRFPDNIFSGKFDGRSRVYNLHKDVGMAMALADELGAGTIIGRDTFAYIQAAMDRGMVDEDFTRLYPILEELQDDLNKD
jgi:3-hydroxyisobutyrate dehydrogenase